MLKQEDREAFQILVAAIKSDQVCLLETKTKATGEYTALICGTYTDAAGETTVVPIATMLSGDPTELYCDVTEECEIANLVPTDSSGEEPDPEDLEAEYERLKGQK